MTGTSSSRRVADASLSPQRGRVLCFDARGGLRVLTGWRPKHAPASFAAFPPPTAPHRSLLSHNDPVGVMKPGNNGRIRPNVCGLLRCRGICSPHGSGWPLYCLGRLVFFDVFQPSSPFLTYQVFGERNIVPSSVYRTSGHSASLFLSSSSSSSSSYPWHTHTP